MKEERKKEMLKSDVNAFNSIFPKIKTIQLRSIQFQIDLAPV